ncbi:hypothetical protein [Nocardiopsis salina]|nr:hypothetical protein [Nocardiopsis salina]
MDKPVYETPFIDEAGDFLEVTGALVNSGDETHFPGWWRSV